MRWALSVVLLIACGARSEIAGEGNLDLEDGGAEKDATLDHALDGSHDAGVDVVKDAAVDVLDATTLCCDDGFKQSGCHTCAQGDTCWSKPGACEHPVTNCGPSNCEGCCDGPDTCMDGLEIGACGNHGQLCQSCVDSKNEFVACVADDDSGAGGTCLGGPTCTTKNCLTGCCNGNVCMVGRSDTQCGDQAASCADCTKLNGKCTSAGSCEYPHQ